jgi:N-acetylneuraminate synthase
LLTRDLLTSKKPGTGIPLEKLEIIIGKKAKRKIYKNKLLSWEDLEN